MHGVNYSDEGLTPGFFQTRLRGNRSGREAPRDAIRGTRRNQVLAAHGLLDQGEADPNQGQLFKPGPKRSPEEMAHERGIAPPLASSKPGFMPGLERKTERGRRSAVITGVSRLAEARTRSGRSDPSVAGAMAEVQGHYDRSREVDWYVAPDPEGGYRGMREGAAHTAIANAAMRTDVSHTRMTRATALTSPRTSWDEGGAPGTTGHSMPNLEAAESVTRAVKNNVPEGASLEDIRNVGAAAGKNALADMAAKAAEYHHKPTNQPIGIMDPSSQKVPNFEQSLHLSHVDPVIRRQAAGSYTVDKWATQSMGGDEKMLKTDTGYAVAHMVGTRNALQNRELPPVHQQRVWDAVRSQEQPESMRNTRLFVSTRSGKLKPNPAAMPPGREELARGINEVQHKSRIQSRGESMGLEF